VEKRVARETKSNDVVWKLDLEVVIEELFCRLKNRYIPNRQVYLKRRISGVIICLKKNVESKT